MQVRPGFLDPVACCDFPVTGAGASSWGEAELIAGVHARDPKALAELHDRFAQPVLRILRRILGADHELSDLHHDVFVRALRAISELRDPLALRGWMHAIAVNTAHACIERRMRQRRWLFFVSKDELPEPEPQDPRLGHEAREAVRATYAVLDRMPTAERIAFALRYLDEMELTQVATACNVSLASIKRRLARAEARFVALARTEPALAAYLEGSARWNRD